MKILIVEDDKKLALTYKNILSNTFDIYTVTSIKECRNFIKTGSTDVILLDIMLPDGNGYDVIPYIQKNSDAIVIIISALGEEETRRIAYEKGADDYMIKPITLFELEYKLKALRKRYNKDKLIIEIGDITLNLENLTISTINNEITIQHSQGIVLRMLYEKYKKGELLTKSEVANLEEIEKTDNFRIHTLFSRLRKNIEKLESDNVFIENVYGKGYRLVVMK
ncbi:MAG: response regulator transcription factor [Vallitalea sp.]|jgi:DNA-binding response OmpR family regulator|nr:response regulator transcription factor [Vallitalea sp.]